MNCGIVRFQLTVYLSVGRLGLVMFSWNPVPRMGLLSFVRFTVLCQTNRVPAVLAGNVVFGGGEDEFVYRFACE